MNSHGQRNCSFPFLSTLATGTIMKIFTAFFCAAAAVALLAPHSVSSAALQAVDAPAAGLNSVVLSRRLENLDQDEVAPSTEENDENEDSEDQEPVATENDESLEGESEEQPTTEVPYEALVPDLEGPDDSEEPMLNESTGENRSVDESEEEDEVEPTAEVPYDAPVSDLESGDDESEESMLAEEESEVTEMDGDLIPATSENAASDGDHEEEEESESEDRRRNLRRA